MRPKTREWGFWTTHGDNGEKLQKRRWVQWEEYEDKFGGNGGCE